MMDKKKLNNMKRYEIYFRDTNAKKEPGTSTSGQKSTTRKEYHLIN